MNSLTLWYPRHKLQFRIGIFFGAASLAGAFSGLLAYGISFMSGTGGLLGWSWIFVSMLKMSLKLSRLNTNQILEGILTVLVGILAFFGMFSYVVSDYYADSFCEVLVDFPATANFLTLEERSFIVHTKSKASLIQSFDRNWLICTRVR